MLSDFQTLKQHFARMGADLQLSTWQRDRSGRQYDLNIFQVGRQGQESFRLSMAPREELDVLILDINPQDRHLLLMVKQNATDGSIEKHRYLCGHDERSWFIAAVPNGKKGISNIIQAKEALKPQEAAESQRRSGVKRKNLHKRSNKGYLRQGEWFFIPTPNLEVLHNQILHNEPVRRGRGKPHIIEQIYRRGGTTVYVSHLRPEGISQKAYEVLVRKNPKARAARWQVMTKDPEVFGCGWVRHPDHATIVLRQWHKILPNTESRAAWTSNMTFLD